MRKEINERKEKQNKLNDRVNFLKQSRGEIHATIGDFFFVEYSLHSAIFWYLFPSLPLPHYFLLFFLINIFLTTLFFFFLLLLVICPLSHLCTYTSFSFSLPILIFICQASYGESEDKASL